MVSTSARACPCCGAPRRAFLGNNNLKVLLVVSAIALYFLYADGPADQSLSSSAPTLSPKEEVLSQLEVRSVESLGPFGVLDVKVDIHNPSGHRIKDVKIRCIDKSETYAELATHRGVVYKNINAGGRVSGYKLEMGLAHSQRAFTICEATDLELVD